MIVCLSASHRTTTLPLLEALKINNPPEFTLALIEKNGLQECVLLQTCHRVEIFCVFPHCLKEEATKRTIDFWSKHTGVSGDLLEKSLAVHYGNEALRHLFNLATGLESMVLGEDQILGQVKNAFLQAQIHKTTGLFLSKAFMKAINIGKKVRTETKINQGSVSVSSAAIELAEREIGNLSGLRALVIGAGGAGTLAATAIREKTSADIFIANRTYVKAQALAEKISGKPIEYGNVLTTIPKVDLVLVAVTINKPLFTEKDFNSISITPTKKNKILLLDISQPRAIDQAVEALPSFLLRNIDDLKELISGNLKSRKAEAEKCEELISEELGNFKLQLCQILAEPLISEIYHKYEEIRKTQLSRAIQKIGELDSRRMEIIDRFSRELTERIAQIPIQQLRDATLSNNSDLLYAAEDLFKITAINNQKLEIE
jgi:glutamyl-tRNA reductase